MSKIRFILEVEETDTHGYDLELCTNEQSIDRVIEAFRAFLLGCGFHPDTVSEYFDLVTEPTP